MKIMTATIRPCTETENEYRLTESHEAEFGHEWDGNIKAYILNAAEDESATLEAMAGSTPAPSTICPMVQSCSPARTAARWSATGWRRREFHWQGGRQGSRPLYPSIHTGSGQGGLLPWPPSKRP